MSGSESENDLFKQFEPSKPIPSEADGETGKKQEDTLDILNSSSSGLVGFQF